ncbi:MAG: cohesin domain-containing protein [bacterium]
MRTARPTYIVPGLTAVLATLLFIACGGSGNFAPAPQEQSSQPAPQRIAPQQQLEIPETESAAVNRVVLQTPALVELSAGEEFTAVLHMDAIREIHQGVLRLQFDATRMEPIEVLPGELLPAEMVRIADISQPGFIPLAFTALPGGTDIGEGSGELFRIRFRLLSAGSEAGRPGFKGGSDFLQLRDRQGRHLSFELGTEAGGSDVN